MVLATTLTFACGVMAFAAPAERFTPIRNQGGLATVQAETQTNAGFFMETDSEGFAYKVGDEVEVKIDRGLFTVRCKITDRKDGGWINGNMYYVVPTGKLNGLQDMFFSEGWVHESEIQTINPQPVFEAIIKIIGIVKWFF